MYLMIYNIFNKADPVRQLAERLQSLEYKYESVSYVESLIRTGQLGN